MTAVGPREACALAAAAMVGLALAGHAAWVSSATYDEVAYLRIAARFHRTGDQAEIARMGSPASFWKIQQGPVNAAIDAVGYGDWLDHPLEHQIELLRVARLGALWIWLVAWAATVAWAGTRGGPPARIFAAWLFALSPNLLAHGGLITMEMPLVAASVGVFAFWDGYLRTGDRRAFAAAAACAGVAFSCKFTAILFPPILAAASLVVIPPDPSARSVARRLARVVGESIAFLAIMGSVDLVVTGFARIPLSAGVGAHPWIEARFGGAAARLAELPWPIDLVGFLRQIHHQRSGGPSYLFGEVRSTGWWYYYPVAIAVKTPLAFLVLVALRAAAGGRDRFPTVVIVLFLAIAMLLSKRNYGLRYLLPLAPVAIVWISTLAARPGRWRWAAVACLLGQALAVASIHPHELSFFNRAAGGIEGGRRILSDSNLDWGQGLRALAALQRRDPRYRDVTLYYFGDTEPFRYEVVGVSHVVRAIGPYDDLPPLEATSTTYLAVSTSLVWGPWGPDGMFAALRERPPVASTPDGTILIYENRAADGR